MKRTIILAALGAAAVFAYYKFIGGKQSGRSRLFMEGQTKNYLSDDAENKRIGMIAGNQSMMAIPPLMDIAALTSGFLSTLSNVSGSLNRKGEFRNPDSITESNNSTINDYGAIDWNTDLIRNSYPRG